MRSAHTVAQVRAAERERLAALPESALMRRAAAGLASVLVDLLGSRYGRRVVLLVGSGDNGGDALHAGADLARRGVRVHAVLLSERVHPGALSRFRAARGQIGLPRHPEVVDLIVDGIVGIGGRPGLRPEARAALDQVSAASPEALVVAVDVPSGVEVDTGECPRDHVRADVTVTFGTLKVAQLVDPAALACGVVQLVDLDLALPEPDCTALGPAEVAALLPVPAPDAHKYTRGVLGVHAGSARYPGAGLLCVAGAASGLCGMVRYLGSAGDLVLVAHPEVVHSPGRVQAWALGSGLDDDAPAALEEALATDAALVIDADALPLLAAAPERLRDRRVVLTPHAGELAHLLGVSRGEVEARMLTHAREAARRFDAVLLLKGRHTLVAHPDGRVRVNTTGTAWLAGAGAGDVLTGLIGALLAAGLDPFDAASAGAWLHGAAATLTGRGGPLSAGDLACAVPRVVTHLLHPTEA